MTTKGILWDTHQKPAQALQLFAGCSTSKIVYVISVKPKPLLHSLLNDFLGLCWLQRLKTDKSIIYDSGAFWGDRTKIVMSCHDTKTSALPPFFVCSDFKPKKSKAGEEIIRQGHVRQTLGCSRSRVEHLFGEVSPSKGLKLISKVWRCHHLPKCKLFDFCRYSNH